MKKRKKIFQTVLFLVIFVLHESLSFQVGCNARNGRFYRHGETTVTRESNNRLYKCTCLNGQRNCSATKEDAYVLIADVDKIDKITLAGGRGFHNQYIRNLLGIAVAVDVDLENDLIFWTDVSYKGRGIYRARYSDGSRITRILSYEVYEPNGLSVDWLSKNIYWTDAQLGAIFVAKNDGRMRTRLISGLPEPRSIVVIPQEGLMFWSDQTAGTIERARMDGTDRRVIITGLVWPNEIAIDRLARRVYWIDAYQKRIESCNFDGGNYARIFDYSYTGYNLPGFGLALLGDHLYFGVWNETGRTSSMFSITKIGQHFQPIVKKLGRKPMGMTMINTDLQTYRRSTNPCWSPGSGLCSHLCLPKSPNSYRCACPSNLGLVLAKDGRNCRVPDTFLLYTSIDEGTVMMVSTESGADRMPTLFAQSHQPSAVAFDPVDRVVYWSDVAVNAIFRKRLGDINATKFIQDGIGTVDGLCIDHVNRHLYFTNMGWYSSDSPYHQVEMVDLRDAGKRKVLTTSLLEKPRDILIDMHYGFLYITDWGSQPKVIRTDLDGQSPFVLPIKVENPNGIALNGFDLYVVDSHLKSAIIGPNGTVIYGRLPSMIKYNTRYSNFTPPVDMVNIEIPFGLANNGDILYMTDWGLQGIYEVNMERLSVNAFLIGIRKPTGITQASLRYQKLSNICVRNSRQCSDICVSIASVDYACMCPDRSGTALSSSFNCVLPDTFMLVADESQIVMKSFDPPDNQRYAVVRTFDLLSNIVAVTYDPEAEFIYWADNGRHRILRKNFRDKYAGFEVIYTEIGKVEGMAIDPVHRLLYWTDSEKGTIELLALVTRIHATVRKQLEKPRAIALNPDEGLLYWTEEGDFPLVLSSTMSGQNLVPLITKNLKWPNALYFDKESDLLWVADGGTLEIMSITAGGDATILDQRDESNNAGHIFGLWRDPTVESYASMIYTDWSNRTIIRGSEIFLQDLIRPSQIYIHKPYRGPIVYDHCRSTCSHVCVPTKKSFVCMCPDHLVLDNDLTTCITKLQAFLKTSTTALVTTTSKVKTTTVSTTTPPWAIFINNSLTTANTAVTTAMIAYTVSNASRINAANMITVAPIINITSISIAESTTPIVTEPILPGSTAVVIPPHPFFKNCDETNTFEIPLPDDSPVLNITASLLKLTAFDGFKRPIPVFVIDDAFEDTVHYVLSPAKNRTIRFEAGDAHGRHVSCFVKLAIVDQTPPKVHFCPTDMEVETYSEKGEAFVSWKPPKFVDNSDSILVITQNTDPGSFRVGLYNITYRAADEARNTAYCIFQLVVLQKDSECHKPYAPRNSQLMCNSVKGIQQCSISCDEYYQLSLADPVIKCTENAEEKKSAWTPFLGSGVCTRPLASNIQQKVYLQYNCPCQPDFRYYDLARGTLLKSIKEYSGCKKVEHRLGFCFNKNEGKLHIECIEGKTLNVTVTVDLDNLRGLRDTKHARDLVGRGVNDIIERAIEGSIMAPGHNQRKSYSVNTAKLRVSRAIVTCAVGFKSTEEGCVQCPKGTYIENNKCQFCPRNTYQDEAGRQHCIECPQGHGTTIYGATDKRYCQIIAIEATTPVGLIIAGVVCSLLVVVALVFLIVCVRRRKRNNKIKKEQERKRRLQEEKRRQRAKRRSTESRRSRKSDISRNEKRKPLQNGDSNKAKSNRTIEKSQKNVSVIDPKSEALSKEKFIENNKNANVDKNSDDVRQDEKENSGENTKINSAAHPDNNVSGKDNKKLSMDKKESQQIVLPDPPLKSALKKPKKPTLTDTDLEEDASTIISASTITSAQLARANIKPRSSSLDQDTKSPDQRGRPIGRSMTQMRQSGSAPRIRTDGPASMPAQMPHRRRSLSFDRGKSAPPPRRMFSHRSPQAQPKVLPHMLPGMPQQGPGIRVPVGPVPGFTVGPPPNNRQSIYGTFNPKLMPPPQHPGIYGAMGGSRIPMMRSPGGTLPRMRTTSFNNGFWNESFEPPNEWDHMALGTRPEMQQPTVRMMSYPRTPMPPRYRIPGVLPNIGPYPHMQNGPPPYYP